MRVSPRFALTIPVILFCSVIVLFSQSAETVVAATASAAIVKMTPTPAPTPKIGFARNVALDQKAIWSSPFHIRKNDLKWLVPVAAVTTALIVSDRKTSAWVDRNGSLPHASRDVSYGGGIYADGGVVAGFYLMGHAVHDRRASETGKLAAEALIDTSIVTEILKLSTQRMRPNDGTGRGLFFKHGHSFPSGHAASAWAVATVVASEYKDRPLIKYGAFVLAAAISMSRYSGRNHFLSDVVVGSSIGYGIGRFVYRTHH